MANTQFTPLYFHRLMIRWIVQRGLNLNGFRSQEMMHGPILSVRVYICRHRCSWRAQLSALFCNANNCRNSSEHCFTQVLGK